MGWPLNRCWQHPNSNSRSPTSAPRPPDSLQQRWGPPAAASSPILRHQSTRSPAVIRVSVESRSARCSCFNPLMPAAVSIAAAPTNRTTLEAYLNPTPNPPPKGEGGWGGRSTTADGQPLATARLARCVPHQLTG